MTNQNFGTISWALPEASTNQAGRAEHRYRQEPDQGVKNELKPCISYALLKYRILKEQCQCMIDHTVRVAAGYSGEYTHHLYGYKHDSLSGMKLGKGVHRAVVFSAGPQGLEF